MSKGKRMTEETYNKAKKMLDSGMSHKFVCDILGISKSTSEYIKRSKKFQDYRAIRSSYYKADIVEQQKMDIEPPKNDEVEKLRAELSDLFGRMRNLLLMGICAMERWDEKDDRDQVPGEQHGKPDPSDHGIR